MTGHHLVDLLIALSNCRWLVLGVLVAHGQFDKKGGCSPRGRESGIVLLHA